jgi:hypothetical protein
MSDLRVIPSIEQLRQRDAMRALETRYGRGALLDALRAETAGLRDRLASGHVAAVTVDEAITEIEIGAEARLRAAMRPSLIRVVNATGVIVHTNLGRAPLSEAALARMRGHRGRLCESGIRRRRRRARPARRARREADRPPHRRRAAVRRQQQRGGAACCLLAALAQGRK